jgi:hypothetical protein
MVDCEDSVMLPNWVPAFEKEKRVPDFCPLDTVRGLSTILGTSDVTDTSDLTTSANLQIDEFNYIPHSSERRWLYGRFPAVDILNLESNEGAEDDTPVRILFAGKLVIWDALAGDQTN